MWAQIKQFPWLEVALIVGLALALIVRPGHETVVPPDQNAATASFLPSLGASTQPRASL
jgi:hypothetical protein